MAAMDSLIVYKSIHKKIRVGKPYDGGYVICDLPGSYDCIIGCGIADDISFEQKLLEMYPSIPCYAFDGTIEKLPVADPRISFVRKNVGVLETDATTNLHCYLEKHRDVFMKMDIEGHEFRVLPVLVDRYMDRIKQLVLEVHTPGDIRLHPDYFKGLQDVNDPFMLALLGKIKETHTLVHVHGNNCCRTYSIDDIFMPNVFECTFVRNDCIPVRIPSDEPIPSPIDMPNGASHPDIVLKGYPWQS